MSALADLQSWARKQGSPATLGIQASLVAAALLFWFTRSKAIQQFMLLEDSAKRPWSFLTYPWADMPLVGFGVIWFVILLMWLQMVGSYTERELGSARFLVYWFCSTFALGCSTWVGTQILNTSAVLQGAYLPVSAVTMFWCARNQTSIVRLYGIVPLTGKWLAVGIMVLVLLTYGYGSPLLGAFAALPLLGLYAIALGRFPAFTLGRSNRDVQATRAQARYGQTYYDDVRKREQEREERERLRKLFESSMKDDE